MKKLPSLFIALFSLAVIIVNVVNNPDHAQILFMEMNNWLYRGIWMIFVLYSGYNFYQANWKK